MSDIAKGILGGGWSLVAGWILPTAINVLLFGLFVLPSLHGDRLASYLSETGVGGKSLVVLGASVVAGLTLSALQTPLYRVLEGYLLWPRWLARKGLGRQLRRKSCLKNRVEAIRLRTRESGNRLTLEEKKKLKELESDLSVSKFSRNDRERTVVQVGLLRERLRRYPVDDEQVAPTRLGNAVRRLEEYGYQRYLLDSQAVWYELKAVAPRQLSRQVEVARAGVDFFVCLLYGNLLVAATAIASLAASDAHYTTLLVTAVCATALAPLWYRLAEVTTDDWALATRALVDVARKPLAEAVGLELPKELSQEREMWRQYCRFVRRPYDGNRPQKLDEFRVSGKISSCEQSPSATYFTTGDQSG
jgi:hypothetical protein